MRWVLPTILAMSCCGGCVPYEDRPMHARSRTSLTGETTTDRLPGAYPYPEEINRLRIGMTRREAYRLLGEPRRRIAGPQTVWIYGEPGSKQLLLTFETDRLAFIQ